MFLFWTNVFELYGDWLDERYKILYEHIYVYKLIYFIYIHVFKLYSDWLYSYDCKKVQKGNFSYEEYFDLYGFLLIIFLVDFHFFYDVLLCFAVAVTDKTGRQSTS